MTAYKVINNIPPDYRIISDMVDSDSRVLDLGCGEGDLLAFLTRNRNIRGQGIELKESALLECVKKGLSVCHGDIESGLPAYPDRSFDYVILNQSLQEVRQVDELLEDALRVGRQVIVGFPNFAWIGSRCRLFFQGRSPVTAVLPYQWYDSPNVRFFSINDFRDFCTRKRIRIHAAHYLRKQRAVACLPNLLAELALFLLSANSTNS